MSTIRPYEVTDVQTGAVRLVRAATQPQAIRHATLGRFTAKPASAERVIELMTSGVAVETARAEPQGVLPIGGEA